MIIYRKLNQCPASYLRSIFEIDPAIPVSWQFSIRLLFQIVQILQFLSWYYIAERNFWCSRYLLPDFFSYSRKINDREKRPFSFHRRFFPKNRKLYEWQILNPKRNDIKIVTVNDGFLLLKLKFEQRYLFHVFVFYD